jgi:uncharacterized membrane protein YdjX (TVP38/TMEM64 family)
VSEIEAKEPSFATLRRAGQVVVLAVLGAAAAAAWRWRGDFDPLALTALIRSLPAAPIAFIALHIVASLTFVPRSLLGVAAGLIFGIWWGLFWAALGSVVGAIAGFLLARYVHSSLFERARWSRFAGILARADRGGWRMVAIIRLVPVIPHSLSNYALGLTRLRLGDYALGSLLGQLPLTIAAVNLGAAGERAMQGAGGWLWPTLVGLGALALTALIPALIRWWRGRGE